jgi:hypothetical protein
VCAERLEFKAEKLSEIRGLRSPSNKGKAAYQVDKSNKSKPNQNQDQNCCFTSSERLHRYSL